MAPSPTFWKHIRPRDIAYKCYLTRYILSVPGACGCLSAARVLADWLLKATASVQSDLMRELVSALKPASKALRCLNYGPQLSAL